MELYTLKINVTNQRLSFGENPPEIFSGDQSIDFVEFTFTDDTWNFPDIWAIFSRQKGAAYQIALEDNKVMIPAEVMQKRGYVYIGLMATDGENVQTSNVLQYSIGQGSTNVDAITPSASIYEQFLADLDAYQEAIHNLQTLAATAETLPAGSDATASFDNGVLELGIPKGDTGATGNGIQSITKTGTSGNVDTYTITYTNGQTTTFTVTNGEITEAALAGIIAAEYDSTKTYDVGDFCLHSGALYECTTAITTAEAWNSAHWTQTAVSGQINELRKGLIDISESSPNIWKLDDTDVTINVYKQYGNAGTELLPAGTYTFSANITSDNTVCAVIGYTANQSIGGDIACNTGSRTSKTFTANEPIERLYIYAGSNYAGASGHTATFNDIQLELGSSATSYEEPFTTAVDKVARTDVANRDSYMGVERPNLLNNTLSYRSDSGVTFTVNDDKTITVNGTASATARTDAMTVTLSKGKYLLTGCPDDASNYTYYYFIIRGNGSYTTQSKDYVLDVTDETETIQIYIRVDSGKSADHKVFKPMVLNYYSQYRGYVPYGEIQEYLPIRGLIDYTEFNWSGKKANFIGDSMIEGVYNIGSFVDITSRILNLGTVRNYGVGGCRMASTDQDASYPPVVNRYANMDNDADIVWVHAGTNDWASQVPLGADDSTDITTFNGALNTIMSGLRAKYPISLIVFSNILPRQDYDAPSHGGQPMTILTSQYSEAIKARCKDHHMVYYDAYSHCGFDFEYDFENSIFATTNDGLHPNSNGIKILGRKVAGFIKWN